VLAGNLIQCKLPADADKCQIEPRHTGGDAVMSEGDRVSELLWRNHKLTPLERKRLLGLLLTGGNDRVVCLLRRIEREWRTSHNASTTVCWLLKYRQELRDSMECYYVPSIKYYISTCPAEMIPLSIWLWGQCANRFRLYGLSVFCHSSQPRVRRHVAKVLRRLEAWALLNEMAAAYPDDAKIQWYATAPTTPRTFAARLKKFTTNVDASHSDEVSTPSRMPFWASDSFWARTPPKSALLIRRMLRRIQHWVRWGVPSPK
jgi:hypothetical protein